MLAESHFNFHKAADMLAILRVGRAALSRVHVKQELPFHELSRPLRQITLHLQAHGPELDRIGTTAEAGEFNPWSKRAKLNLLILLDLSVLVGPEFNASNDQFIR
jgi:hypothetical protein